MPVIKFVKEKIEVEVPVGANLRDEAIKAGVNVHQGINGIGANINKVVNFHLIPGICCGSCGVNITKGMENTNTKGPAELAQVYLPIPLPIAALTYVGNSETMRLSCKTKVLGDIEVETGPEISLFGENFFS